MFRQILDDTRALLADLKQAGLRLATRWQWLRLRSRRRMESAGGDLDNVRRAADARIRMCRECRALIPAGARTCPECGVRPGPAVATGLTRVATNMLPGTISVTAALMTLILLVYGLTHVSSARLSAPGALIPENRPHAWLASEIALGANVPVLVASGEIWRLVTMMFLHGGLLHLIMNCWAFLSLGPLIEGIYGPRKLFFLFVVSGVGSAIASYGWRLDRPQSPAVGASGALFGLIGVAAVWGWRRGGSMGEGLRGLMVQWALYGLVMGVLIPGVDNAAHVGGLVTGAMLALLIRDGEPVSPASARLWSAAAWGSGIVIAVSFVMIAVRYQATIDLLFAP